MLTPQDVQSKEFVKAVFGGYDMSAVDEFLEELSKDYAALYKDNAILKSKIKVLVEKVEEYRSTEDAMRMALLTAQKMGDDLLANAKQKSKNLLVEADSAAKSKMELLQKTVDEEEKRLRIAREQTEKYVRETQKALDDQSAFLKKLMDIKIELPAEEPKAAPKAERHDWEEPIPVPAEEQKEPEKTATDFAADIVSSEPKTEKKAEDEDPDATKLFNTKLPNDDTVNWEEDLEMTSPRPKFNFDDLQFGENYSKDKK